MALGPIIADTDVVIDYLRGHGEGAAVARRFIRDGRLLVTAITAYELLAGVITDRQRVEADTFCRSRTLELGWRDAVRAGGIATELRVAGTPIGPADTLIAGICLQRGLPLATKNQRHFRRVTDLEVISP